MNFRIEVIEVRVNVKDGDIVFLLVVVNIFDVGFLLWFIGLEFIFKELVDIIGFFSLGNFDGVLEN